MFLRSDHRYAILLAILLVALPLGGALADYHGEGSGDSGWMGEFPPDDYNPYLPESQRPAQQLMVPMQSPLPARAPVSPRLLPAPVVSPAPAATYPGYYSPQVLPLPSVSPYAPGLYAPDPGLYPGYFYPFNNNQYIAPLF